jgi:hypothetical protein
MVALVARGKRPSTTLASSSEARGAEERDLCLHEGEQEVRFIMGAQGIRDGLVGACGWQ